MKVRAENEKKIKVQQEQKLRAEGKKAWSQIPQNQVMKEEISFMEGIAQIVDTEEDGINIPASNTRQTLMKPNAQTVANPNSWAYE